MFPTRLKPEATRKLLCTCVCRIRALQTERFCSTNPSELFILPACLIPVQQPPGSKRIIVILENLENAALSELLGEFLQPLENRGTENPCTLKTGTADAQFHWDLMLLIAA